MYGAKQLSYQIGDNDLASSLEHLDNIDGKNASMTAKEANAVSRTAFAYVNGLTPKQS